MVACEPISDAREPWIVVFKKGVDSNDLYGKICPSVGIGVPAGSSSSSSNSLAATDDLEGGVSRLQPAPLLNCTARFNDLLNGFAGA
jgi:hypothetical protein